MSTSKKNENASSRTLGSVLAFVFNVLIIGFLILYISRLDFSSFDKSNINWFLFASSLALAVMVRFFYPFIWVKLLEEICGERINNRPTLNYIYAKSWMGRYLPGKVTWLVGKIVFARNQGIKTDVLVLSSIIEIVAQSISSLALGVLFLGLGSSGKVSLFENQPSVATVVIILIVAMAGFVIVLPPVINWAVKQAFKIRHKKSVETSLLSKRVVVMALVLFGLLAILNSVPLYMLYMSLVPEASLSITEYLYISGAFLVSGVLGLLALFAPSGLGVREGSLIFLLNNRLLSSVSVVVAIGLRIWSIIVDAGFFVIALYLQKGSINSNTETDQHQSN